MENEETLQSRAGIGQTANAIHHGIDELLANGIVSSCIYSSFDRGSHGIRQEHTYNCSQHPLYRQSTLLGGRESDESRFSRRRSRRVLDLRRENGAHIFPSQSRRRMLRNHSRPWKETLREGARRPRRISATCWPVERRGTHAQLMFAGVKLPCFVLS